MSVGRLALTCGDPAGVGPDVVRQWAQADKGVTPVHLFGPKWLLDETGLKGTVIGGSDERAKPGIPTEAGARMALASLEAAAQACLDGDCVGAVTGPVSKSELIKVGFAFPGQTEFFGDRWKGIPTMGFVGKQLKVVLATWHIPLAEVSSRLQENPQLIERAIDACWQLVRAEGIELPRIAVCGINPHAGECGLLGKEEGTFLDPLLDRLRGRYLGISKALPGDTVFWRMCRGEFDGIVAMYHDQGLGPLKTLEFDTAVNVTLGLPWVRTSPDHGTGFDIAGSERVDGRSFARAVEVARMLARKD